AELQVIKPALIVCLGATAAQALLGKSFRVTKERGKVLEHELGRVMATVHPSSILRAPDEESRERETRLFIDDLRVAARLLR
ncbi:MAG TPA: uracil-DNA glycosylase family protein, partial [Myxococcales bacterium]|nr:uracil-DNA glycosylase family protein [Myxococcales bacterium]